MSARFALARSLRTWKSEVRVQSLDELYRACRDAPPADLVRVLIKGGDGDVTLNFASFIRGG